jgi:hypothetical protein
LQNVCASRMTWPKPNMSITNGCSRHGSCLFLLINIKGENSCHVASGISCGVSRGVSCGVS